HTLAIGGCGEQRTQMVDRTLLASGELLSATAQLHQVRCQLRRTRDPTGAIDDGCAIVCRRGCIPDRAHCLDHAIHALGERVGNARRLRLLGGRGPSLRQLLIGPRSASVRVHEPPLLAIEPLDAAIVDRLGLVGVLSGPASLLGGTLELAGTASLGALAQRSFSSAQALLLRTELGERPLRVFELGPSPPMSGLGVGEIAADAVEDGLRMAR